MDALAEPVERVAGDTGFSGVVRVDRDGEVRLAKAYGLAHRGWGVANTVDTRFAIASGTKGLTALTVVGLIEDGRLAPDTTAGIKRRWRWIPRRRHADVLPGVYLAGSSEREPGDDNGVRTRPASAVVPASSPK